MDLNECCDRLHVTVRKTCQTETLLFKLMSDFHSKQRKYDGKSFCFDDLEKLSCIKEIHLCWEERQIINVGSFFDKTLKAHLL